MNKNLFPSSQSLVVPTDTTNHAGGLAYLLKPEEALAQIACTGFFGDTFYVSAEEQLREIIDAAKKCDDDYVAQVARYARKAGFMKDAPAVLVAYLFGKQSPVLTQQLFDDVIDNAKMLSNFVQAVRSGQLGRRSLGRKGQRLITTWLNGRKVDYLWKQSIAKDPSLADIIRLSRPKTRELDRNSLYRHLIGKEANVEQLPTLVQQTLAFLKDQTQPLPDVPFNMVDGVPLTVEHWKTLFTRGGFQFVRMNLNTAQRQGVLKDADLVKIIVDRLSSAEECAKARQFPYQMLAAYKAIENDDEMPFAIRGALHQAMENATRNVPELPAGEVYIAVDTSGSMSSPITGAGRGHVTRMRYCDAAGVFAAAMLRKNPSAKIMTFAADAVIVPCEPMDTVMTTAQKLAQAGGGTDCSAPLRLLAKLQRKVDLFILISDNESWLDHSGYGSAGTGTVAAWDAIKKRNQNARQVRINISPNATDQLPKRSDTLRVAGFSDAVFAAVTRWASGDDFTACIRNFAG